MNTLLAPSDIAASPGLISPLELRTSNVYNIYPLEAPVSYDDNSEFISDKVNLLTFDELVQVLDGGNVGIGWQWIMIISIFLLLILFLIPLVICAVLLLLQTNSIANGSINNNINYIPEGQTVTLEPSTSTNYILNVNYNNNISNNTIQSTLYINGNNGRNNLFNGSRHIFTASSSYKNTSGPFSTILNVKSVTSPNISIVGFKLIGNSDIVNEFTVFNDVLNPQINSTYASSRIFIWKENNILYEIDSFTGVS